MLGYFYGNIVSLEGAFGLRSDQPGRRLSLDKSQAVYPWISWYKSGYVRVSLFRMAQAIQ